MTDENQLESIAQQLAARVREESVEDYTRWLTAMLPNPNDWFRLAVVLACAVPDDQTWNELTAWTVVKALTPKDDGLDHIAIERAIFGEQVKLTLAERQYAVDLLHRHGLSNREIARRLHTTDRSVSRHLRNLRGAA